MPFLAISFYNLSNFLVQKRPFLKRALPLIIFFATVINISMYTIYFSNLGVVKNISSIIELIKKENPKYLYGTVDITPALAFLTKIPLLDNIVDTNPNIFGKKILDNKKLTQKAIDTKTIVVARGNNKLSIADVATNVIFDKDLLRKHCKPLAGFPTYPKNEINRIILLKCY